MSMTTDVLGPLGADTIRTTATRERGAQAREVRGAALLAASGGNAGVAQQTLFEPASALERRVGRPRKQPR
jgi:hypothetical protein